MADLAEVLDPEELVLADPGPAGLWLHAGRGARPAGSVVVPVVPRARLRRRRRRSSPASTAVRRSRWSPRPTDPATDALLDLAASLGVTLVCEVWGAEASWASPSEHRERLIGARHEGGVQRLGVPVDLAATRELVDLAGPVQAWTGEPVEEPGSFA